MSAQTTPDNVVYGDEAAAVAAAFPRPTPAPELKQLDFLLGDFRCEYVNMVSQPPTGGTGSWNTKIIDGGHFLEMNQLIPTPGLDCKLIFGWNVVKNCFVTFYHDDFGYHGTTTSPGWEDGHIRFTGDYVVAGQEFVFQEDFTIVGPDHYRKIGYVKNGDDWNQVDSIDCYRVSGE